VIPELALVLAVFAFVALVACLSGLVALAYAEDAAQGTVELHDGSRGTGSLD